ncbi:MAG: sigma-70 family RNA polymerase sigma factor [Pirellulaceae bacterium]|nr:sigma-70 family RNA polymerase sigma factor [Pirellulaceae bacterium]
MLKQHEDISENRRFNTTQWSVVLRACQSDQELERNSWNELIETYWFPLYAFCRRQGKSHQDAQDLTQSFFTHLMTAASLDTVSPMKGRFRSFLLASFRNFIANQVRAAMTIQRGGKHQFFSLSADDIEAKFSRVCKVDETPERAYDRNWVEALLLRTKSRLAEDYRNANKQQLFELLEPHLMCDENALSRLEIGNQLKMSQPAIAMSIHRMRRRFGDILLSEVSRTVDDPADAEDELRRLMAIVRGE